MARYNIRDWLGHWVKPRTAGGKPCPHACCRGRRQHPPNFPVILGRDTLRAASDQQLAEHYAKHAGNGNARRQIEAEMNRRDRADERRKAAAGRSAARRMAADSERHRRLIDAEAATKGYMVTERGRARGITDWQVLTRKDVARRYGSDELLAYLDIDRQAGNRRRRTAGGRR